MIANALAAFWAVWGIYLLSQAFRARSRKRPEVIGNILSAALFFATSYQLVIL